jgi:hypothetical protein
MPFFRYCPGTTLWSIRIEASLGTLSDVPVSFIQEINITFFIHKRAQRYIYFFDLQLYFKKPFSDIKCLIRH